MDFSREPATPVLFEKLLPLMQAHHREVGHFSDMKLAPVYDGYLKLEEAGILRIFLVSDSVLNTIVGYNIFFTQPHIHYCETVQAYQDAIYISPRYRGRGSKFIRWCDDEIFAEGITLIYQSVKAKKNHGPLLVRLGYNLVDLVYVKRFE